MKKYSFDAVIFDLDGVVTKTATVHAKAWKRVFDEYLHLREKRDGEPFREFTHEGDYLPYVDGIPRYEGVKSFLQSRNIKIPFGKPEDSPDKETICGLGNKKNSIFRELLKKDGAEIYPSTIQLIKSLKNSGIRIGVASSSKNCKLILQSTGIEGLFETRVDGEVSDELGLKGKPEGDIFVTAAYNLEVSAGRAVVVEDATSGVQAGRNGEFGLVLGVARKKNKAELLENGADIVVRDLSEIDIEGFEKWFRRTPRPLFEYWEKEKEIKGMEELSINPYYFRSGNRSLFSKEKIVFFLDYDGTLTPIVERPEDALISEEMRSIVKRLSEKCTVAIVSGRMRENVEKLVRIKGLFYAGSHGFDIRGPKFSTVQPKAKEAIPLISKITAWLTEQLGDIPSILVEDKKFSTAVHYRLVDEKYLPKIREKVNSVIQKYNQLQLMRGKKVYEILPRIDWDKGKSIRWVMEALKISWCDASIICIGDDTTDEFAFRTVRTRGTGILVSDKPKKSAADFRLASTDEVKKLFEKVIASIK